MRQLDNNSLNELNKINSLIDAVKKNDLNKVKELATKEIIDKSIYDGRTVLYHAFALGHIEIAKYLKSQKANYELNLYSHTLKTLKASVSNRSFPQINKRNVKDIRKIFNDSSCDFWYFIAFCDDISEISLCETILKKANRDESLEKYIANALHINDRIFKAEFSGDGMTRGEMENLVSSLNHNNHLIYLFLADNYEIKHVLESKSQNIFPNLIELCLNYCDLTDAVIANLVKLLYNNNTISFLDLSNNMISKEGVIELAEMLKTNKGLLSLDLSNNMISKEGIIALAEMLKTNKSLISLDLSNNDIDEESTIELAERLKGNTGLITLNLSQNKIGLKGAMALAEMLKTNKSLMRLNLSNNDIAPDIDPKTIKSIGEEINKGVFLTKKIIGLEEKIKQERDPTQIVELNKLKEEHQKKLMRFILERVMINIQPFQN